MTDYDAVGAAPQTMTSSCCPRTCRTSLTQELDGASAALGVTADEILLAAFGRAIARTIGEGVVAVDVPGHGTHRAPGGPGLRGSAPERMPPRCWRACTARSRRCHCTGSCTACLTIRTRNRCPTSCSRTATAEPGAARARSRTARTPRDGEVMALDWWYDARSFEPYTIEELVRAVPVRADRADLGGRRRPSWSPPSWRWRTSRHWSPKPRTPRIVATAPIRPSPGSLRKNGSRHSIARAQ